MNPVITHKEKLLEQLTRKAFEAAKKGKWNDVIQLYDQRVRAGFPDGLSPDVAKQLMKYDQWMVARIREVQALTQQHLGETQGHRRQLEALKRQWVDQQTVHIQHRLSI
ncbi:MAG: hypothetical protein OEY91_15320 [Nitrospirota bacterium]|nr:hypothetical protein [Nitrospirota bacterium]